MDFTFKHVDGKIILVVRVRIWDGDVINEYDVTDKLMDSGVVDDYLDHKLGLDDYKRIDGVITYVGKDKDRYKK